MFCTFGQRLVHSFENRPATRGKLVTAGRSEIIYTSNAPNRPLFSPLPAKPLYGTFAGTAARSPLMSHTSAPSTIAVVASTVTWITFVPSGDTIVSPMISRSKLKYRSYLSRSCRIVRIPCWQFISTSTTTAATTGGPSERSVGMRSSAALSMSVSAACGVSICCCTGRQAAAVK